MSPCVVIIMESKEVEGVIVKQVVRRLVPVFGLLVHPRRRVETVVGRSACVDFSPSSHSIAYGLLRLF